VLLTVFIEPDTEPITGWLEAEHGPRRSFSGWLELTALLSDVQAAAVELPQGHGARSTSPRSAP
jgi:hypothetical protein